MSVGPAFGDREPRPRDVFAPLRPLRDDWARALRVPRRRATFAFLTLLVVTAFLIARRGTFEARAIAAGVVALSIVVLLAVSRLRRRRLQNTRWVVERLVGAVEPAAAGRALRALTLVDPNGAPTTPGVSEELTRLHVERTINALPRERVLAEANRLARRFAVGGIVLSLAALVATVVDPWAVFEGADVLAARRGVAPLSMQWIDDVDVRARPPEYLHMDEVQVFVRRIELPRGTLLTIRGRPTHGGRRLFLSDGQTEVPCVDDGTGRVVARWPLGDTIDLRVVSRFGSVVIEESQALHIESIPDRAPQVSLEGAPKHIALGGEVDVTEIPVRYEAVDDHGLREVHLVLRSGPHEERRVLAKLDGETRTDRGGYVLRASDTFVKKSHAPIEVTVEAKDNDPITGPKWGASAAITLVPPHVGEPEARRIEALKKLRDALVDRLATRIDKPIPTANEARKVYVAELVEAADADGDLVDSVLSASYAGVRLPGRLQAMLRAQQRKLDDAVRVHARATSSATLAALVKQNERFVLVVDATLRGLGGKDARDAAKRLVEVGEDLANELGFLASGEAKKNEGSRPRRVEHADAAVAILSGSAGAMKRLGVLGHDIGGAVDAALVRVARARTAVDLAHAELAARDLVWRLRHPDPSFGSQGSSSGRAGGESGGGRGVMDEGEEGEGSEVERAFSEAEQDLEKLIEEHAKQKGLTEQAMSGASPEELKAFAEEAKKHAEAVREATGDMPSVGGGSDSWTSKGAAAREHAEQMARSLEQGNPADAVASGKNALQALEDAKRLSSRDRFSRFGLGDTGEIDKRIEDAKKKLEPEVKWTEEKLEQMKKRAAERASGDLQRGGEAEQKLAERMGRLAGKGKEKGALPSGALDSLESAERAAREAANALQNAQGERGLERQSEAQRMLEQAREAMGNDTQGQDGNGKAGEDGRDTDPGHADIPKADAHKGPEEFRRRVIQGLGQPSSGRLKDAVRRYAEGLLR